MCLASPCFSCATICADDESDQGRDKWLLWLNNFSLFHPGLAALSVATVLLLIVCWVALSFLCRWRLGEIRIMFDGIVI
jgi:hypothetical protein